MPTVSQAIRQVEARFSALLQAMEVARAAIGAEGCVVRSASKIEKIQHLVADHFGFTRPRLLTRDRHADLALARQVAMSLCRELTRYDLSRIGRDFGGFDHGTVIHAVKAVRSRSEVDADFAATLTEIRERVRDAFAADGIVPPPAGFRAPLTLGKRATPQLGKTLRGAR